MGTNSDGKRFGRWRVGVACASILSSLALGSCMKERPATDGSDALRDDVLPEPFVRLLPLATPMAAPVLGDWLSIHDEAGQTLAEFRAARHRRPGSVRRAIVLARLGKPSAKQHQVLERTARYLEKFYRLPVRFGVDLGPESIPSHARRPNRGFGPQVETRFVLESLLLPSQPADAFLYVALSTLDLYPRDDWNFVFGQARPADGVGVWSIARFGDPDESASSERAVLSRTLRTASHEIGHLLGLSHCIAYRCLMNGSNSLDELDARPLELCPICMAKVCGGLDLDPSARVAGIAAVLDEFGLAAEADQENRILRLLEEGPSSGAKTTQSDR
jgi:archaemetzincin